MDNTENKNIIPRLWRIGHRGPVGRIDQLAYEIGHGFPETYPLLAVAMLQPSHHSRNQSIRTIRHELQQKQPFSTVTSPMTILKQIWKTDGFLLDYEDDITDLLSEASRVTTSKIFTDAVDQAQKQRDRARVVLELLGPAILGAFAGFETHEALTKVLPIIDIAALPLPVLISTIILILDGAYRKIKKLPTGRGIIDRDVGLGLLTGVGLNSAINIAGQDQSSSFLLFSALGAFIGFQIGRPHEPEPKKTPQAPPEDKKKKKKPKKPEPVAKPKEPSSDGKVADAKPKEPELNPAVPTTAIGAITGGIVGAVLSGDMSALAQFQLLLDTSALGDFLGIAAGLATFGGSALVSASLFHDRLNRETLDKAVEKLTVVSNDLRGSFLKDTHRSAMFRLLLPELASAQYVQSHGGFSPTEAIHMTGGVDNWIEIFTHGQLIWHRKEYDDLLYQLTMLPKQFPTKERQIVQELGNTAPNLDTLLTQLTGIEWLLTSSSDRHNLGLNSLPKQLGNYFDIRGQKRRQLFLDAIKKFDATSYELLAYVFPTLPLLSHAYLASADQSLRISCQATEADYNNILQQSIAGNTRTALHPNLEAITAYWRRMLGPKAHFGQETLDPDSLAFYQVNQLEQRQLSSPLLIEALETLAMFSDFSVVNSHIAPLVASFYNAIRHRANSSQPGDQKRQECYLQLVVACINFTQKVGRILRDTVYRDNEIGCIVLDRAIENIELMKEKYFT